MRVERPVPRHRPRLLARRRRRRRATSATGCPARRDLYARRRPARRTPRSTSSPRTTASRCATWCPTTRKHNEANGEDNRDGTDNNRSLELRRRGRDRRPGDPRAARAGRPRNLLATLLLSDRRADDHRRRRARPHPGRQQQRLLPGQRDLLGGLATRRRVAATCYEVTTAAARGCAASTRCCGSGTSSRAGRPSTGGPQGPGLVRTPTGREMTDDDWFDADAAHGRACTSSGAACGRGRARGERHRRRLVPAAAARRRRRRAVHAPGRPVGEAWEVVVDTATAGRWRRWPRSCRPARRWSSARGRRCSGARPRPQA